MKKTALILPLLWLLLAASPAGAQYVFEGKLVDADTGEPVKYARLWISQPDGDSDTLIYANEAGYFKCVLSEAADLSIHIEVENYRDLDVEHKLAEHKAPVTFRMYKYGSESYRIEDIAREDAFSYTVGFDFLSPAAAGSTDKLKSAFAFYYGYEFRIKIAANTQVGIRYEPLRIKWINLENDTTLTTIPHNKEYYSEVSTSLTVLLRYIISTTKHHGYRGAFVDIGFGYHLPYSFRYIIHTDGNIRISQRKIHRFNDLQAMLRLGYNWCTLRASYRFSNIMKENFVEPPRLAIGIEISMPL